MGARGVTLMEVGCPRSPGNAPPADPFRPPHYTSGQTRKHSGTPWSACAVECVRAIMEFRTTEAVFGELSGCPSVRRAGPIMATTDRPRHVATITNKRKAIHHQSSDLIG